MLELRPNCEMCDRDLPCDTAKARICSYECTFCPNCGGGFVPRPIRPKEARRSGVSRNHQPPGSERRRLKYTLADIALLVAATRHIPPQDR